MSIESHYFLGVDVGGTKTHALIADETGQVLGFGESGPGNHESVGYAGLVQAMHESTRQAMQQARLSVSQIAGAGFGVAGYDWPSERQATMNAIRALEIKAPVEAVNDTLVGLLAGSPEGWGVGVVAGTGCNCRGWDKSRQREGMVTGAGDFMGEAGGAVELVAGAIRAVSYEWAKRGPATLLTPILMRRVGVQNASDLLEGLIDGRLHIEPADAPLVFQAAAQDDAVAIDLIRWMGHELGELANCVIRQLGFEDLEFDVVQVGSLYGGSPLLTQALRETVLALAPRARFMRLTVPPVVGAVLLGMEQAGLTPGVELRQHLTESIARFRQTLMASS
jgi:N-acetylglucosamine kinase-like BadF-type ATPase